MSFVLVRSPRALIDKHQIGYGWSSVNFSAYKTTKELFEEGFCGKNIGRKRKQIQRYFNLKKDDVVIVPLAKVVAFAIVEGKKSHHAVESGIKHGENRVAVNYLTNEKGEVYFYPRKDLSTKLEARLKIRTSIAQLDDFSDDLQKIVDSLKENKIYTVSREISEKREQEANDFKALLLSRLRSGKNIWIEAGGYGLELLVKEIFEAHGYAAKIQGKSAVKGEADLDVVATRANIFTGDVEGTLIQVKHHKGTTKLKGINQLKLYDVDPDKYAYSRRVLVTTAELGEDVIAEADAHEIKTIDGEALVDLIYENLDRLSESTLKKLGVVTEPSLVAAP